MFTTISWSNYLITVGILLICWYLFLLFKYYAGDLKQLLSGEKRLNFPRRKKLAKGNSFSGTSKELPLVKTQKTSFLESTIQEDCDELSVRLCKAVFESAEINLGLIEFKNYLRFILSEYPFVKKSSLREKINKIIVSECEKHPLLVLTYEEVDSLWEEAI